MNVYTFIKQSPPLAVNIATRFQTGDFPFPMVDLLEPHIPCDFTIRRSLGFRNALHWKVFFGKLPKFAPLIHSSESLVFFL